MSIFATRLKELRGPESQASFASSLGLNRVQYAKYESGQNWPSVEVLERICRVVSGVSADWLLGLKDRGTPAHSNAAPGDRPDCKACPHLAKLRKLEAILGK